MAEVLESPPTEENIQNNYETCNGKVLATGFGGALTCDAVNGSIEVSDGGGPVRATTVNGSLRIAFRGPFKQSRLETVNGSVEVAFDRHVPIEQPDALDLK